MDFGFVPQEQLQEVDFSLPPDSPLTQSILNDAKADTQVYVGCAKWGRKEWVGLIYPERTREINFLDEYVKHFNSIELNAVFYNMPKKEQIRIWKEKAEAAKQDFKFCPKFTRSISHIRRLKNAEDDTTRYLESISEFGSFLGNSFLQLSDNFGPKNFDVIKKYLEGLPRDFDVSVEVRHPEWYGDKIARKDFFEMLRDLGTKSVITDASGRRDCVHMELSTPDAFIRFVGNGLHPTDFARIDEWAERLKHWKDKGLKTLYFFLHQHDEKDTPVLADYTIKRFNEILGTSISTPCFINRN